MAEYDDIIRGAMTQLGLDAPARDPVVPELRNATPLRREIAPGSKPSPTADFIDPNTGQMTEQGWARMDNPMMGFDTGGVGSIRAYHGSPHWFDRFDMSKIGSGEGNQIFSRGLYFAENEKTARSYRDTLSKRVLHPDSVQEFNDLNAQHDLLQKQLDASQGGAFHPQKLKTYYDLVAKMSDINDRIFELPRVGGHMYEVKLNVEPEQLLDWNKPLRAQPSGVRNSLSDLGIVDPNMMGSAIPGDIARSVLVQGSGRFSRDQSAAKAVSQLNDAGIPGVRYLDAGSRGVSANPSYNIVMYNDKLIDLMRRYGIAGMVGGGAAAAALPGQQDQVQ